MGQLRRLPEAAGPTHDLLLALRELHLRAGEPSTRVIARRTHALSHDTVHRSGRSPSYLPARKPLSPLQEVSHCWHRVMRLHPKVEVMEQIRPLGRVQALGQVERLHA